MVVYSTANSFNTRIKTTKILDYFFSMIVVIGWIVWLVLSAAMIGCVYALYKLSENGNSVYPRQFEEVEVVGQERNEPLSIPGNPE